MRAPKAGASGDGLRLGEGLIPTVVVKAVSRERATMSVEVLSVKPTEEPTTSGLRPSPVTFRTAVVPEAMEQPLPKVTVMDWLVDPAAVALQVDGVTTTLLTGESKLLAVVVTVMTLLLESAVVGVKVITKNDGVAPATVVDGTAIGNVIT